jgi:glucosyl-3-phosphoglycerate synthase
VQSPADWFEHATSRWTHWTVDELRAAKGKTRVSVVIPARNEAPTIGSIVAAIAALRETTGLVDELVVIDSDSTDDTPQISEHHGAVVHAAHRIRPELGSYPGKGEALWKSQFVTSGDVLVFIDADLIEWGPHFVTGLIGPILADPAVELVKGFYDRILEDGSHQPSPQGGRVTELVARPLLNLHWPELTHVVQPLAGEWAIRRRTFASLHIPTGYGVEMSILLDVHRRSGLPAIAQVDLGERAHSHQSVHDLGLMAAEVIAVADRRTDRQPIGKTLWQFNRAEEPRWRARDVPFTDRPPVTTFLDH